MKRMFTRGEIEAWFMEHFGKAYVEGGDTVKIGEIALIEGAQRPLWIVEYTVISQGYLSEHRYHSKLMLTQEKLLASDGWRITFPDEIKLPPGCSSVAEEDKAIKAEAEEAERNAERRARVETSMAVDYGGDY